jgi:hypothetical protein
MVCLFVIIIFFFSCLYKEVQRFSWKQEKAGYYNSVCCCAIVSGIFDGLYMANEEEENKR